MEEKLIVRSEFISFKPFKIIMFVACGILSLALLFCICGEIFYAVRENAYNDMKDEVYAAEVKVNRCVKNVENKRDAYNDAISSQARKKLKAEYEDAKQDLENARAAYERIERQLSPYREDMYSARDVKAAGNLVFGLAVLFNVPILLIILYIWLYLKFSLIVVSNKRIVGKTLFKRVDLPIDSVSAVSSSIFSQIGICTGRGTIRFAWLKNRNEMYSIICDLLVSRQPKLHTDIKGNIEI